MVRGSIYEGRGEGQDGIPASEAKQIKGPGEDGVAQARNGEQFSLCGHRALKDSRGLWNQREGLGGRPASLESQAKESGLTSVGREEQGTGWG